MRLYYIISATASSPSSQASRYSPQSTGSFSLLFTKALLSTYLILSFLMTSVPAMTTMPSTRRSQPSRGSAFAASLPPLVPTNNRRLILVRHGQTDWNAQGLMQGGGYDIPLNQEGCSQAQRVAEELSGLEDLRVMASSHLQRSRQTAQYILDSNNNGNHRPAVVMVDERFGEMRFGSFEGTAIHGPQATAETKTRFRDMTQRMKTDIHLAWPESDSAAAAATTATIVETGVKAESTWDVSQRGVAGISDLLAAYPDESHVCVVAHGRFNKVLLATLLWKDPSRFKDMEQGNTCINVIDYHPASDTWNEVILNYTDHAADTANAKQALNK